MSPSEVLNGRKCRVPTDWNSHDNRLTLCLEILAEMVDTNKKVCKNLKDAHDRQKIYAGKKRLHNEFQFGDHVYLKVKCHKSSLQWKHCAKLAPQYCGPFQILEWIGLVAYKLALPGHIQVEPKGEFLAKPLHIHDRRETILQKQAITQVKV
eukprot:PITA_02884